MDTHCPCLAVRYHRPAYFDLPVLSNFCLLGQKYRRFTMHRYYNFCLDYRILESHPRHRHCGVTSVRLEGPSPAEEAEVGHSWHLRDCSIVSFRIQSHELLVMSASKNSAD